MTSWGLDLGSRLTKVVRLEDGRIAESQVFESGHDPLERLGGILEAARGRPLVATGYGRRLAEGRFGCPTVTEIRACARAAQHLDPEAESAVDIGGKDAKAIELSAIAFGRFEMNDRCAAGTGRFLEVMAAARISVTVGHPKRPSARRRP